MIQLNNGTWIDPKIVTRIRALAASDGHGPRVVVETKDTVDVIACDTAEEAQRVRDNIASSVIECTCTIRLEDIGERA